MHRLSLPWFVLAVLLSTASLVGKAENGAHLHTFPIAFEENYGQSPSTARYHFHRDGIDALFGKGTVEFHLAGAGKGQETLHLEFAGSGAAPLARQRLAGHANYFLGNDPASWVRNVPLFAQIEYADLYPGISLSFYGNGEELEHNFRVAPGADPASIQFHLDGHVERTASGDLAVHAAQEC